MTTPKRSPLVLRLIFLACLAAITAQGQYTYYFSDNFVSSINSASYWTNGWGLTASNGLYDSDPNGGALISKAALPTGYDYEVKATLHLDASSGGAFIFYVRATSNSQQLGGNPGTYYSVDLNPGFSGGVCNAGLSFWKSIAGSVSMVASTSTPCHDGSVVRVFVHGGWIGVWVDSILRFATIDNDISSGQPGIGGVATGSSSVTNVSFGPIDSVAPNPVNAQLMGTSSFPNRVDLQWAGALDNTNGTGVAYYDVYRNGGWIGHTITPQFSDTTVAASTSYTYGVVPVDYHFNWASTSVPVVTPATGSIDPRQVGVRPLGSYWGGGGEQLDMQSGNLNYTVPLIKALGRGGWGVQFNLSYNSENWRQDSGGTWQLGRDVGYGYGWRLQAGSLTPVYSGYFSVDHYLFIDSTGAEYRLDQNSGGVWSSKEGIYVYYDSNTGRLYFTDGSYWVFGALSGGGEEDAGTLYPTQMKDTNGNYINITYDAGAGVGSSNSSARIIGIEDVRGYGGTVYGFTYDYSSTPPHLTTIGNDVGTAENYSFTYTASTTLLSPFSGASYGTFKFLATSKVTGPNLTTTYAYDSSGSGELSQVTTPYGGHLRWVYNPYTLVGSRTQREVLYRYVLMATGGSETTHVIFRPDGSTTNVPPWVALVDLTANAEKDWIFQTDMSQIGGGLVSGYHERIYPTNTVPMHNDYTWAIQATSQNRYISGVLTSLDYTQSTQVQKQTTQTIDQYGNMTQQKVYDFGNLTTPARTYNSTYLASYTSLYILNRLVQTVVTDASGKTATLVSNSYDAGFPSNATGLFEHDASYGTSYGTRGNLSGTASPGASKSFSYDIGGNVTGTVVNNVTTSVTTNASTNYAAPSQITTNSLSSNMNYTAALNLSSATGPNGDSASIAYDTNSRPTSTTAPTGAVTTYGYHDTATPPYKTATTNGHWTRTSMDGFGRTIKVETGYGDPVTGTVVSTVDSFYAPCGCSPLGKLWKQTAPYAPGITPVYTTYTYDARGRTLTSQAPDGSTTSYSYAGNLVTVTSPNGTWKKYTMDAFSNLTSVLEPDPTLGNVTTSYTYDLLNHLTQVSMPRGTNTQTRTFNYTSGTSVGAFLLSATNPENGTVTYTYNLDNSLATKTDAKGQVFSYTYDSYKRVTQISVGGNVIRTFSYDTNPYDGTFSHNTSGRLAAVKNATFAPGGASPSQIWFTEMYNYQQAGQVTTKRLQVAAVLSGVTKTVNLDAAYTYDNEGKMTSVNYPSTNPGGTPTPGPTYTYSFDSMGRAVGLVDQNSTTIVNSVSYNGPAAQLSQLSYYGVTESRSYNSMMQMTNLNITGQLNINYNYPAAGSNAGKISSQTDVLSGETVTYAYDSLNRLASASGSGWNQNFGYDGFGNLVSKTGTNSPALSVAVDAATNRIVGQSYDANGNQLTASGVAGVMTYDAENRIVAAGGVSYLYDSQNKRVWKGVIDGGGNVTSQEAYFYGLGGQKLGTYSLTVVAGPNLQDTNTDLGVYFGGKRIWSNAQVFAPDRLGSKGKYFPYGEDRGTPLPNDQVKFATYTRDSATGLDYASQRYYANNFGRFMTADRYPIAAKYVSNPANPQTWNRYAYVVGDPVNLRDPSGYCGSTPPGSPPGPAPGPQPGPVVEASAGGDSSPDFCPAPDPSPEPPGGPGGPPGSASHQITVAVDALVAIWEGKGLDRPSCQGILEKLGVNSDWLQEEAGYVNPVDGSNSSQLVTTVSTDPGDSAGQTIKQLFDLGNPKGIVQALAGNKNNVIYINGQTSEWSNAKDNGGWAYGAMMHELIHFAGLTDPAIGDKLIGPGASGAATAAILTTMLTNACAPIQ